MENVDLADPKIRQLAAQMLTALVSKWCGADVSNPALPPDPVADSLLALVLNDQGELRNSPESLSCAGQLLSIEQSLQALYVHQEDALRWLQRENLRFNGLKPLTYMANDGIEAVHDVYLSMIERVRA